MPWHIAKRDDEFCVVKDADGSTVGCHDSKENAAGQLRALYASEKMELDESALALEIELFDWAEKINAFEKERDVNAPGGGHNLRNFWVRGPGAARIGWGTDGAMRRCMTQLGAKGVKSPGGLCAEYHKAATGEWPRGGKVESALLADGDGEATTTVVNDKWEGILAVEGVETGDARKFSTGSLQWAEPPIPLMWARQNLGAHQGSVMVGRIEKIWRDPANPAMIRGSGVFDLDGEDGREAHRQVSDKFLKGISIDPDQIGDAETELIYPAAAMSEDGVDPFAKPQMTVFHGGRIRAATLVQIPAFVEAQIALAGTPEGEAVAAAGANMAISTEAWSVVDNDANLDRELPLEVARSAYAYVNTTGNPVKIDKTSCGFLHHEISESGEVGPANLHACQLAMSYVMGERGKKKLSKKIRRMAYDHLAGHLRFAVGDCPDWDGDDTAEDMVACAGPSAPPKEWFGNPRLPGPTPFTVTDSGQVYGHAALWGSCHTSFGDSCVQPPHEASYDYFMTGEVVTADGTRVPAGQITLGTSHAATRGITAMQAVDHYGNTGTAVADVAAGTDEHGIWVAGAMRPGVEHTKLHALRAAALSGDWRRLGGNMRMVALLAVNVPGFPVPRLTTTMQDNRQMTLVASGVVTQDVVTAAIPDTVASLRERLGLDTNSLVAALKIRVEKR